MIKYLKALILIFSLAFTFNVQAAPAINVCAVTQLYSFLMDLKNIYNLNLYIDTASDLYADIANNNTQCDIVLSYDEKLPINLIRSNKAHAASLVPIAKTLLIVLAHDPKLFANNNKTPIVKQRLKSLALADTRLTPVGFATHEVVKSSNFPTQYLKDRIYRADHEYQVLSMLINKHVQTGIVSLVTFKGIDNQNQYSYYIIPQQEYPELLYYALLAKDSVNKNHVIKLFKDLKTNATVQALYLKHGLISLNDQ